MRTVEIVARVKGRSPSEVFEVLSDFERYPELTEAVHAVSIEGGNGPRLVSTWEVGFRNGVLRWTEEDEFDGERRTIAFNQLDGDFEHFAGVWRVEDAEDGCVVRLRAEFDLGMPTLADMLDPIAESALRENMTQIVEGLFDRPVEVVAAGAGPGVSLVGDERGRP